MLFPPWLWQSPIHANSNYTARLTILFHSNKHQNMNLPLKLHLAPAVQRGRSAISANCFRFTLTCNDLHLPVKTSHNNLEVVICPHLICYLITLDPNLIMPEYIHFRRGALNNASSHTNSVFSQQPEDSEPVKRLTRSAAKSASGKIKVSWLSVFVWFLFMLLHLGFCTHDFETLMEIEPQLSLGELEAGLSVIKNLEIGHNTLPDCAWRPYTAVTDHNNNALVFGSIKRQTRKYISQDVKSFPNARALLF